MAIDKTLKTAIDKDPEIKLAIDTASKVKLCACMWDTVQEHIEFVKRVINQNKIALAISELIHTKQLLHLLGMRCNLKSEVITEYDSKVNITQKLGLRIFKGERYSTILADELSSIISKYPPIKSSLVAKDIKAQNELKEKVLDLLVELNEMENVLEIDYNSAAVREITSDMQEELVELYQIIKHDICKGLKK